MKSNSIFFNTLMLAAPVVLWLQGSALAQPTGASNPAPPPAPNAGAAASTNQDSVEFFFPGGTPSDFLNAVEKQYKVDWKKVADIPNNMLNVHIPALRMNRQSSERILGPEPPFAFPGSGGLNAADRNPLKALIALYNSLGGAKPELGNLLVEGDLAKPSVVIFHSSAPPTQIDYKVKAFALKGISPTEWERLVDEINSQFDRELTRQADLAVHSSSPMPKYTGHVILHPDTSLLVVDGPVWSVELAESFVAAWKANRTPDHF